MAFRDKKRNRESKTKKTNKSYPRIWLNVKRRYHSLTFSPVCPKLSQAEFQKCKERRQMPSRFSIPILMKDVRNVLFKADRAVYIHWKVSKFLIANPLFRKALNNEIKRCEAQIEEYKGKLSRARVTRSLTHWSERIESDKNRLVMLNDLRATLLENV